MKHPKLRSFRETINAFRRLDYYWLGWVRTFKTGIPGLNIMIVKTTKRK